MRINQNVMAFNAQRQLDSTSTAMGKSLEKLSSGFRINRAADDAAGLVKSESLRSEIGGSKQAQRNVQDAISLVQTIDGAMGEATAILQRWRDLAVSAANTGTNDGVAEEAERDQLFRAFQQIASGTRFNGTKVFNDGWTSAASADVEFTFQVGANAADSYTISAPVLSASLHVGTYGGTVATFGGFDLDVGTGASQAIDEMDGAISALTAVRAKMGATQNRLEHTAKNLGVSTENLSAAESRIRDTDMAAEMVSFTKHQILQQAGTSMLSQANQAPQSVLSLLR